MMVFYIKQCAGIVQNYVIDTVVRHYKKTCFNVTEEAVFNLLDNTYSYDRSE